ADRGHLRAGLERGHLEAAREHPGGRLARAGAHLERAPAERGHVVEQRGGILRPLTRVVLGDLAEDQALLAAQAACRRAANSRMRPSRPSALDSIWRTRSGVIPSWRPISRSGVGSPP